MYKKMKVLICIPPIMFPTSVHYSLPLLYGQLKKTGIDVNAVDLNVEFFKYILSKENLLKTIEILKEKYNKASEQEYKLHLEWLLVKNSSKIYNILNSNIDLYKLLVNRNINEEEKELVHFALILAFSVIKDTNVNLSFEKHRIKILHKNFRNSYEKLVEICEFKDKNIYISFYKDFFKNNRYDVVFISIPFEDNLYPALTLGKFFIENDINVVIGGALINDTTDAYLNHPEMFDYYFNSIINGYGEHAVVEYIYNYLNKSKKNISGLIYKKNNIIVKNKPKELNINNISYPNYDFCNFDNYIFKGINISFSKGCYWSKCIFCQSKFSEYYSINPIKAVDIIEKIYKEYNIKKFNLTDNCLSLNFSNKFADEIFKRNLNINFSCSLRFEKWLTLEFLIKLKKAGLRSIFFGLESASQAVLKRMNKGIDLNNVDRILNICSKLNINVLIACIVGFPGETEQDLYKTIYFYNKYIKLFNFVFSFFTLKNNSNISNQKKKFGITDSIKVEEFSNYELYNIHDFLERNRKIKSILNENKIMNVEYISTKQ